ncbi:MAG: hypothetical protein WA364_27815, partial [Candidatus Nitrosopolaris sp.]
LLCIKNRRGKKEALAHRYHTLVDRSATITADKSRKSNGESAKQKMANHNGRFRPHLRNVILSHANCVKKLTLIRIIKYTIFKTQ